MKIEITQKNYEGNQRLFNVIEAKLSKIERFLTDNDKIRVKLSKARSDIYTMEISVVIKSKIVRAVATTHNMWDNIDIVLPKLERQINRFNDRFVKRSIDTPTVFDGDKDFKIKKTSDSRDKIVREKNFSISIITPEQAVEEMELLDHNFYIFVNAENNKISVLYKRLDDNYGLISPEY